jgi:hypothetical protein
MADYGTLTEWSNAPTTAWGYRQMFSKVSVKEWGAADGSASYPLKDGRRLWLYGDTLSVNNGFVHSTAIVQDGGSLHVSHGGKQLLPNGPKTSDGRQIIYWMDSAVPLTNRRILIKAAQMSIGTGGLWDFQRLHPGMVRVAHMKIDATGNVTFVEWKGWAEQGPERPVEFTPLAAHHFLYNPFHHTDIHLDDGKTLVTWSQNWDDSWANHVNADGSFRYSDFRPLFKAEVYTP